MLGMDQMYKMALDPRIYPDSRLLSIMQGKDQSLPMAIAMAAKQQRDKLTQASQGQQAEQGSKQPSVKDQMLAKDLPPEHSGLAALPAENMHDMGSEQMMAGGGIVAFDDNQDQPVKVGMPGNAAPITQEQVNNLMRGYGNTLTPDQIEENKKEQSLFFMSPRTRAAMAAQASPPIGTPIPTKQAMQQDMEGSSQGPLSAAPRADNPLAAKPGGVGVPPDQGGAAANAAQPQPQAGIGQPPQRVDRFAGLGETQDAFNQKIANEKNTGFSDMLMNMGLTMMTTTGSLGKAIGAGGIAGLPSLAASRKTINALEKNRTDYQLNMAKAQTAADEGNDDLAYKYKTLAEKTAYDAGMLAVEKTKAGAYANAVGSKADIVQEKRDQMVANLAKDIHDKNVTNLLFQQKFAKMSPEEQQQYFSSVRQQAKQMAGMDSTTGGAGSGSRPVPQTGAVIDGHKFKGGNPNDKNNWEPV